MHHHRRFANGRVRSPALAVRALAGVVCVVMGSGAAGAEPAADVTITDSPPAAQATLAQPPKLRPGALPYPVTGYPANGELAQPLVLKPGAMPYPETGYPGIGELVQPLVLRPAKVKAADAVIVSNESLEAEPSLPPLKQPRRFEPLPAPTPSRMAKFWAFVLGPHPASGHEAQTNDRVH